jgi:hypothetical protein
MFGIGVIVAYVLAAHPQPAAVRLAGKDVKVVEHAVHAPPFGP